MHKIKRRTARKIFTDYYLMRFISLLVVTQSGVLRLKRLIAFLFRRLSSSDTLLYYHNSRKANVAQVRSIANRIKFRGASLGVKWI